MSFLIFPHSVDSATITYSQTHDTGYGEEMLNDRNKNFVLKDSAVGATSAMLDFDLGSGVTRAVDYLIIGSYKISNGGATPNMYFYYSDNGSSWTLVHGDTIAEATSATNVLYTFTKSDAHRYYRVSIWNSSGNITSVEIGNIFFGEKATLSTSYELNTPEGRGWKTVQNEGAGGYRFSQIANTTTRRFWGYEFAYITSAEKTALENVSGQVYTSEQLSHYPLYFSPDSGTTIYFARLAGQLMFNTVAYQAYSTNLNFEQEL